MGRKTFSSATVGRRGQLLTLHGHRGRPPFVRCQESTPCPWPDVPENIDQIEYSWSGAEHLIEATISFDLNRGNTFAIGRETGDRVRIIIFLDVHHWKRPWSPTEFHRELTLLFRQSPARIQGAWVNQRTSTETISFTLPFLQATATFDEYKSYINEFQDLIRETETRLRQQLIPEALTALFDFPLSVRTACEQYLLYFVDFLKSLGVSADVTLGHDAGCALFTVAPHSKDVALERIREALNIYLQLPLATDLGDFRQVADP